MQLSSDTSLARAVDSADRMIISEFKVDWDRDGNFSHALSDLSSVLQDCGVQRDANGTLPEETTVLEGFIAAELTVRLAGDFGANQESIAALLSPLRTDSPLYGKARRGTPVRWRLGLVTAAGTVPMMDQFSGYITEFEVVGGEVRIRCLDGTDRLHATINLPVYNFSTWANSAGLKYAMFRVNSQWVIDYILRRNGIYQSPPPVANAIYCATGHGSLIPEIGHQFKFEFGLGVCTEDDPIAVPGRWGLAYEANSKFISLWSARLDKAFTPVASTAWQVQVQVDMSKVASRFVSEGVAAEQLVFLSSGYGLFDGTTWLCGIRTTGQLYCEFYNGASLIQTVNGPTLPAAGWTDIWFRVEFNNMTNAAVHFPGQTNGPINLSGLNPAPLTRPYGHLSLYATLPMQCLQISDATSGANFYDTSFVSQCDLDPGANEFFSLPVRRGVDSLDLLKEIVQNEFGVAGFSEAGRFTFKNRANARSGALSTEKGLSPDPALVQISVAERPGSVRNAIATKTQIVGADSQYQTLFTLRNKDDVWGPIGESFWRVTADTVGWVFDFSNLNYTTSALWDEPGLNNVTNKFSVVDILGTEIGNVQVSVFPDPAALSTGQDTFVIQVVNPNNFNVYFTTTDGRPALLVGGLPAVKGPEVVTTYRRQSSIDQFREQTLELHLNEWRQLSRYLRPLALALLKDLKAPVPILNQLVVVGDPRLQLLDTVELSDLQGLGGPVLAGVETIQRQLSSGKLEDRLAVRMFGRPGRWILGHPTLSVLGQTTILG